MSVSFPREAAQHSKTLLQVIVAFVVLVFFEQSLNCCISSIEAMPKRKDAAVFSIFVSVYKRIKFCREMLNFQP